MESASRVYFFIRSAPDASDGSVLPSPLGFLWYSFLFIFCFPSFGNMRSENESNVSLRFQRNSPFHHFPSFSFLCDLFWLSLPSDRSRGENQPSIFTNVSISHANRSASKLLKSEPSDNRRWRGTEERKRPSFPQSRRRINQNQFESNVSDVFRFEFKCFSCKFSLRSVGRKKRKKIVSILWRWAMIVVTDFAADFK